MLDCDVQKYVSSFVNVSYCPFPSGAMIAAGKNAGFCWWVMDKSVEFPDEFGPPAQAVDHQRNCNWSLAEVI